MDGHSDIVCALTTLGNRKENHEIIFPVCRWWWWYSIGHKFTIHVRIVLFLQWLVNRMKIKETSKILNLLVPEYVLELMASSVNVFYFSVMYYLLVQLTFIVRKPSN